MKEFEGVWDDLAADFGDKKVMGGKPMGCHAQWAGGMCPDGFVCDYALWSLYADVSIDEAEQNVTTLLESKGYNHNVDARTKSDAGPVNLQFENDDEKLEVAIGQVADSAEVIVVRRNPDRK